MIRKKSTFILIITIGIATYINAQVGINTGSPESTLDVRGVNHEGAVSATDGILAPRVNDLTTSGTKNGQLVYLISDVGIFTKGFHYWDGSVWQALDTDTTDGDAWAVSGEDVSSAIKRTGQVGIGTGMTSDPLAILEVAQVARTGTHEASGKTLYASGNLSVYDGIRFMHSNGTEGLAFGYEAISSVGSLPNINLSLRSKGTGTIRFIGPVNTMILNSNSFYAAADNAVDLGFSTNRFRAVYATNGAVQTSDRRLKKNIQASTLGLKEVMAMRPVVFDWKDNSVNDKIGFIAQEIKELVPNVVIGDETKENLGMNYGELVPVLTKAIQEQQTLIEDLSARIQILEGK